MPPVFQESGKKGEKISIAPVKTHGKSDNVATTVASVICDSLGLELTPFLQE